MISSRSIDDLRRLGEPAVGRRPGDPGGGIVGGWRFGAGPGRGGTKAHDNLQRFVELHDYTVARVAPAFGRFTHERNRLGAGFERGESQCARC